MLNSKKDLLTLISAIALLLSCSTSMHAQTNIIFDTDFGGDADDLGALVMLNHFVNKGEIELLAVQCWNTEKHAIKAIDAVNTHYGNPDIPIGLREGETHETTWNHSKVLADSLTHDLVAKDVPEATLLYRKILSTSEDQSIVIVTVGPLLNIKRLIDSAPDEVSALSGKELILRKVKEFVIMGGQFPEGEQEWNFSGDMPGVTSYVLQHLESPVTFLGYEVGVDLKTGEVFNELPKSSPLYLGFYHFSKYAPWMNHQFKGKIFDNSTYDQTAVLYAVRGGIGEYWSRVENGVCIADDKGGNTWESRDNSLHSYLVLQWPREKMEIEIERFMLGKF